jgi:two-component system nitrate/nitrite response regulator NarL
VGSIRVAIVDDHPLFRAGVARSLAETGEFEVVAEGASRDDAVNLVSKCEPEIVLLDISIPGGGIEALTAIMHARPSQKVIMLTVSEAGGDVTRALRAGARGYVLKGIEANALADILTSVASGEGYVSPALSARLLSSDSFGDGETVSPIDELDERQQLILRLVSTGLSNKEIALKIDCHEKTVKHQLTRIFSKLKVSNRTEAAMVFRNTTDQFPVNLRSLS